MSRWLALALFVTVVGHGAAASGQSFDDPAAYCRAVGTVDRPDGRYHGPAVPDWVARSLMRAVNAPPDALLSAFRQGRWRCSGGQVMACLYGANIPCDQKADVDRAPPEGAARFCRQQPDAGVVPNVAFSRPTVFLWRCDGTTPTILRQVMQVDRDGYPAPFWHPVAP